jgi:hypothetical protein
MPIDETATGHERVATDGSASPNERTFGDEGPVEGAQGPHGGTAPATTPARRSQPRPRPVLPPALFRHWVHSREEDAGGEEVYRPEGFAFPPSFGRDGFELRADGTFIQDDVGPADGIVRVRGRWTLRGRNRIAVSFRGTDREGYAFDVVAVDAAVLRIRRLAAGGTGYRAGLRAPDAAALEPFAALPAAESVRRLDFERAEVVALESDPPQYVLFVRGTKPYLNMEVELSPLVYVRPPEYWEIEVLGRLRGIGLPALAPYTVSLRLAGVTGTKGVEVVGATRRARFDVPPAPPEPGACTWRAWLDRQPPGPATLRVRGECEFPTAGFAVTLRRHAPQGFNPRILLLDKVVRPPTGPAAQVVTRVEVRYEEPTTAGFDAVTILPDGATVPVEEVA